MLGGSCLAAAVGFEKNATLPTDFHPISTQSELTRETRARHDRLRYVHRGSGKVEKGCYEVYAIDKGDKKLNVADNAETLAKLTDAEAGEN